MTWLSVPPFIEQTGRDKAVPVQVLTNSKPTYLGIELPFDINTLLAIVRPLGM